MELTLPFLDDVSKLVALGFKTKDCIKALESCEGKLDDAALWLTQNAVPSRSLTTPVQETKDNDNIFIKTVEVGFFMFHFFIFSTLLFFVG